jgi:hypothetical protein
VGCEGGLSNEVGDLDVDGARSGETDVRPKRQLDSVDDEYSFADCSRECFGEGIGKVVIARRRRSGVQLRAVGDEQLITRNPADHRICRRDLPEMFDRTTQQLDADPVAERLARVADPLEEHAREDQDLALGPCPEAFGETERVRKTGLGVKRGMTPCRSNCERSRHRRGAEREPRGSGNTGCSRDALGLRERAPDTDR